MKVDKMKVGKRVRVTDGNTKDILDTGVLLGRWLMDLAAHNPKTFAAFQGRETLVSLIVETGDDQPDLPATPDNSAPASTS